MKKEYSDKFETNMYNLGKYSNVDWEKLGVRSGNGMYDHLPRCSKFWITYKDNEYWCEEKYALAYLEKLNGEL